MGHSTKRALVLDGHSRAAVETLQALARYGVEVDVVSEWGCIAFRSRYPQERLRQPPASSGERLAEWIAAQDARRDYRLIVASTEFSLRAFRTLPGDNAVRIKALLP